MLGSCPERDNAHFSAPNSRLYLEVNKNWCNGYYSWDGSDINASSFSLAKKYYSATYLQGMDKIAKIRGRVTGYPDSETKSSQIWRKCSIAEWRTPQSDYNSRQFVETHPLYAALGSTPNSVSGSFRWHDPCGRTAALGSTQPLTEMSTRNISIGVKAADAYGWQPYHLHVLIFLKSGSHSPLEPFRPEQGCTGIVLFLYILLYIPR
jgi:hypothetical protein